MTNQKQKKSQKKCFFLYANIYCFSASPELNGQYSAQSYTDTSDWTPSAVSLWAQTPDTKAEPKDSSCFGGGDVGGLHSPSVQYLTRTPRLELSLPPPALEKAV